MRKHLVVLTGAGISAESGLKTFRDSDGLWENHRVEDVATPEAWHRDPHLVQRFYNMRRKAAAEAFPNEAHKTLAELESHFSISVITQNVDDLHERGGSSKVLHLHGELNKVRSVKNESLIYEIGDRQIEMGDLAEDGGQLRPHIVWFGEAVPMIEPAVEICRSADIFMVVGTSLQVYPAAGLIDYTPYDIPVFVIDKKRPQANLPSNIHFHQGAAGEVLPELKETLIQMI
ncbi:SIR2 family NAD-dependent protein deacylase [Jiulongibacter sediminis]|uniref:NAD-dependent protein deacylase n=1 Tax=Jiulongibacter sediminis TaxID=1605367 RepID=A0A0P7C5E9_9BACT|nr:NAD-dependent deacylase [Jiulongibacter sediminis]KPM50006.1 NAD-dependent deacetylase [Jiulongibacter sediminis]TBX27035.1 NAD-dependent deacetylase [Jiulongibacter sediminis]